MNRENGTGSPTELIASAALAPAARLPHFVNGALLRGPYPAGSEIADFGMGCFWGAEAIFWTVPGVIVTAAGYQGGNTADPTYDEVCSAVTGHTEVVRVIHDPERVSYASLLRLFWEHHDPTERNHRHLQAQYRSTLFVHTDAQRQAAKSSRAAYQDQLTQAGHGEIVTKIRSASEFYFAEEYHQQYASKHTGVACPSGLLTDDPTTASVKAPSTDAGAAPRL